MDGILHETNPGTSLLSALWGADDGGNLSGVHYIAEPADGGWRHYPVKTVTGALDKAQAISNAGHNAYFACAEYKTQSTRKGDNVNQARAFWLDLDCGEAKAAKGAGYATKREATGALMEFCTVTGLPSPTDLVDSGNGLHVYWVLDVDVPLDDWKAHGALLKALTKEYGLLADPMRTSDIASVLRVPGTMNWKDHANPKPVKIKFAGKPVEWAVFKAALEVASAKTAPSHSGPLGSMGDLTAGIGRDYPPLPETPENVALVKSMLAPIPADCGREAWRNICWAVLSTGWGCGEQLAREWSMTAPDKFDALEFGKVVSSYDRDGGIGFGTLVHYAREHRHTSTTPGPGGVSEPIESALHLFNKRHFVAKTGGAVYVFDQEDADILGNGMTPASCRLFYASLTVHGVNVAAKWLVWDKRRTYQKLVFDPRGECGADAFNLWRGLAVSPADGPCDLILAHIRAVWCGDDVAQFNYVLRWMALLVQRPWEKPDVALVLRSRQGSGKTLIVQILLRIFGSHGYTAAQKDQVAGRFNGHLFDKVLVVLEEAFFAGDPAAVAATNALVTNATLGYEAKGKSAFNAANFAHVISLTNHSWAIPAGEDARRWMVLDVSDKRKDDYAYFEALQAEIDGGGVAAFLSHLMGVDLAGWNPRRLPDTLALRGQQAETLLRTDPVAAWWLHVLGEGAFTVEGGAIDWAEEIPAGDMQESYTRGTARARNAPSWDGAAKRLRQLLPAGELGRVRKSTGGTRTFYYRLPDLHEARAHFQAVTGVNPCEA